MVKMTNAESWVRGLEINKYTDRLHCIMTYADFFFVVQIRNEFAVTMLYKSSLAPAIYSSRFDIFRT